MNPAYRRVSVRADHRCEYCHAPELIFNFPFEVEHIVPLFKGGQDTDDNLALACRSCNLRKGIYTMGTVSDSEVEAPLFNPRTENWIHHFQAAPDTGSLIGLTATGHATINRLQMNSAAQMTARQLWMQLGLFP